MRIAVIPARSGSKRIPKKNIKEFCGKPIIAYSIEAAKQSNLFDHIIVSTNDQEIADIAIKYGASVPFFRSEQNSDDFATLSDVIEEVKQYYIEKETHIDYICCLLATVPFINSELIKEGYELLIKENADSVKPIVTFPFPVQRALLFNENGLVNYQYPEYSKTRSQDLEEVYHDAGMFYWMKFDKGFKGSSKFGFIIPREFAEDIDTVEDWRIAEIKFRVLSEMRSNES